MYDFFFRTEVVHWGHFFDHLKSFQHINRGHNKTEKHLIIIQYNLNLILVRLIAISKIVLILNSLVNNIVHFC